jgi:hypothetical protein
MAQDASNKPGGNSPSPNGLLWLALLVAGAFLVRQLPLNDSRPSTPEPKAYPYFAAQDIDARLWQDPIGAVALGIEQERNSDKSNSIRVVDHSAAGFAKRLRLQSAQPLIVIGVMVPGASYSGYAELRRQSRYAVLSGLSEMGFVPEDPEHLGYFTPDAGLLAKLYADPNTRLKSTPQFFAFEMFDQAALLASDERAVKANTTTAADGGSGQQILLLWLDKDIFWDDTVGRLNALFTYLFVPDARSNARRALPGGAMDTSVHAPRFVILGPGDSGMLQKMASVAGNPAQRPSIDLRFYDYAATVPDARVLPASVSDPAVSVPRFFADNNLAMFRTIGDDAKLACVLRDELVRRGIGSPPTDASKQPILHAPEVVLIAERDTDYGRDLAQFTRDTLVRSTPCPDEDKHGQPGGNASPNATRWAETQWLHRYDYFRGLDGQVPGSQPGSVATPSATGTDAGNGKSPPGNFTGDNKQIERPEGQGQFDYLRRLALRLRAQDAEARSFGEPGIRAVGVLGSDVYDKLIVLQVLKPMLPGAVFFTTDLDAQMLHPLELDWTHNLIVASSFGLELAPGLQAGIPPFRDAYQTSLYLTTLIALTNLASPSCTDGPSAGAAVNAQCPVSQKVINGWQCQPRLFEIGRHRAFDLSLSADPTHRNMCDPYPVTASNSCGSIDRLPDCVSVHPTASRLYSEPNAFASRISLIALTVGVIALALAMGAWQRIWAWAAGAAEVSRDKWWQVRTTQLLIMVVAGIVLLVLITWWLPDMLIAASRFLTQDVNGTPITLFEGVSSWPTELIRLVALLLSIGLVLRGWKKLHANLDHVSKIMHWEQERRALIAEVAAEYHHWTWWQQILQMLSFRGTSHGAGPVNPATGLRPEAEEFWRKYIYQGRTAARLCRIVMAALLYLVFAGTVVAIFPFAPSPFRGALAKNIDVALILCAVLSMAFLIFFVVDATVLCYQFLRAISRHKAAVPGQQPRGSDAPLTTRWPQKTLAYFADKLQIDQRYVDPWITIDVIGLRTKSVSRLIYYPYVIISLVIIARHPVFDNWPMPLALMIILGVGLLIVTACALMLRSAAERARRRAIWQLTNDLIRLKRGDKDADSRTAGQIEVLIGQIGKYDSGSFASYREQPLLRAVMLPLGSFGGATLLQYLAIWNF